MEGVLANNVGMVRTGGACHRPTRSSGKSARLHHRNRFHRSSSNATCRPAHSQSTLITTDVRHSDVTSIVGSAVLAALARTCGCCRPVTWSQCLYYLQEYINCSHLLVPVTAIFARTSTTSMAPQDVDRCVVVHGRLKPVPGADALGITCPCRLENVPWVAQPQS